MSPRLSVIPLVVGDLLARWFDGLLSLTFLGELQFLDELELRFNVRNELQDSHLHSVNAFANSMKFTGRCLEVVEIR